jgi:hypothetical protein
MTLALLRAGLSTIGHGYHMEKCISTKAKSDTELQKELFRLHTACRSVVEIFSPVLGRTLSCPKAGRWRGRLKQRLVDPG